MTDNERAPYEQKLVEWKESQKLEKEATCKFITCKLIFRLCKKHLKISIFGKKTKQIKLKSTQKSLLVQLKLKKHFMAQIVY